MTTHPVRIALLALLLADMGAAHAAGAPTLQEVLVTATNTKDLTGVADSATEGTVSAKQLASRPLLRPAEMLETVPGVIVTQHSGDGKANQYFLRGFNLDHGSDFATTVNGMPINVPTHAHGQGYMDLNFMIPELVASMRYRKGVYAAEDGDFSTTGSARVDYQRQIAAPFVDVTLGEHNYRRLLGAGSTDINGMQLLAGLELAENDGPWVQPEEFRKVNALLRLSEGTSNNGYSLSAMAYQAEWKATEHVPERAVTSGEISRYGSLSPNDGGKTHRYSLAGEWASSNAKNANRLSAYLLDYGLNLFSSPSGFINGLQGDQHEQADQRTVFGGEARHSWFLGPELQDSEVTVGVQFRRDRMTGLGLYETVNRVRYNTIRKDDITETNVGLFAEVHNQWQPWLRTTLGLRHDHITADAKATAGAFNMANGGHVSESQTSPKVSIVLGPFTQAMNTEFYANWGYGYHSNDIRGATSANNPVDGSAAEKLGLFSKAKGSEIGLRMMPMTGWTSSFSLWRIALSSELVFVGDEGVTEPEGASRRHGLEWSNYITPNDWLIIDSDVAVSQARFVTPADNGGTHVPNAIPLTASLGLSADQGGQWFGGLRLRYIGAYALEETNTEKSSPFWVVNLKLGYRLTPQWQVTLDVLNLLNKQANDIEYWGGACTYSEQASGVCNGGIDGRLIHPMEARTFRIGLRASF